MCKGECKREIEGKLDDLRDLIKFLLSLEREEREKPYTRGVKIGLELAVGYLSTDVSSLEDFTEMIVEEMNGVESQLSDNSDKSDVSDGGAAEC